MLLRFASVLCIGLLVVPSTQAQDKAQARTDLLGDLLPDGAIARIGTLRFKHAPASDLALTAAAFSPDGTMIVSRAGGSVIEGSLRLWDAATGKELPGPWSEGNKRFSGMAFSSDGTILAAAADTNVIPLPAAGPKLVEIILWDIRQAKLLQTLVGHPNSAQSLVFADADKTLVSAGNDSVCWWDIATGKIRRSWKPFDKEERISDKGRHESKFFINSCVSPDAKHLAVETAWRENERVITARSADEYVGFDLASGKVRWRTSGKMLLIRGPRFAYSADSKRVAIPNGGDNLEIRDTLTGKLVAHPQATLKWGIGPVSTLALSADGGTVAIAGTNSQLVLWNPDGAAPLRQFVARIGQNRSNSTQFVCFSPNNKQLLVGVDTDLQLYNVATLKELHSFEGHRGAVAEVAFSADGKRLFTGSALVGTSSQELASWEVQSWKRLQLTSYRSPPWPNFGMSNLDQTVFLGKTGDDRYSFFDMTNGKPIARLAVTPRPEAQRPGYFSPNGRLYISADTDPKGEMDPTGGKLSWRLYAVPSGKLLCGLPAGVTVQPPTSGYIAFSPDDRLVALTTPNDSAIQIFEASTGKVYQTLGTKVEDNRAILSSSAGNMTMAFAHDGNLLASSNSRDGVIRIWDVKSGKERMQLPRETPVAQTAAFSAKALFAWSPDSRTLAVSEQSTILEALAGAVTQRVAVHKTRLWELASLTVRRQFEGHQGAIRALACSPDGRLLASGGADSTVLIWDISLSERQNIKSLENAELDQRWQTLAGSDAAKAYVAMCDLAAQPKASVELIKVKLKPVIAVDAKRVQSLIAQLENNQFKIRQQALADLTKIGDQIVPFIDAALAATPTLEVRKRLQELHAHLTNGVLKAERLQAYRAVELLERIETPEAVQLLHSLADGAAGALVTVQAQACCSG